MGWSSLYCFTLCSWSWPWPHSSWMQEQLLKVPTNYLCSRVTSTEVFWTVNKGYDIFRLRVRNRAPYLLYITLHYFTTLLTPEVTSGASTKLYQLFFKSISVHEFLEIGWKRVPCPVHTLSNHHHHHRVYLAPVITKWSIIIFRQTVPTRTSHPATTTFLQANTQSSPLLRSTCPNHLNLLCLPTSPNVHVISPLPWWQTLPFLTRSFPPRSPSFI